MSFNGSGTFSLYSPGNPVVTGTTISSTWANNTLSDIATGLSTCITKDGQTTVTANIPMSGFKFTGLAAGSTAGDSLRYEQLVGVYLPLAGGTLTGNLLFTDATYDIGASGATRPRDIFLSRNAVIGGTLNVSGAVTSTGGATVTTATWNFADNAFLVVGSADNTKKVAFEVDGLTTGTTRTVTIPDKSGTLAMTSDITSSVVRSYLAGCGLSNNGSDATNDIDIAAGTCADSTNAVNITVAAMTKQLDASWAAGTNQGMRYSGAVIANTTYHIWAVAKADGTQDIYATPNASASTASGALTLLQAESGGASYAYARRIGSILRESGAIVAFVQDGDEFARKVPVRDVNATAPGASAVTRTLSVPSGVRVKALFRGVVGNGGSTPNIGVVFSDLSVTDTAPTSPVTDPAGTTFVNNATSYITGAGDRVLTAWPQGIWTNTSAQVRSRCSTDAGAGTTLQVFTDGWVDPRGRND